ncbi:glycoside hydrolase domain-containing protein, partial [Streptomyces sp. NPDC004561]
MCSTRTCNHPAHDIAYMYDAAGEPWKTQSTVREIPV